MGYFSISCTILCNLKNHKQKHVIFTFFMQYFKKPLFYLKKYLYNKCVISDEKRGKQNAKKKSDFSRTAKKTYYHDLKYHS